MATNEVLNYVIVISGLGSFASLLWAINVDLSHKEKNKKVVTEPPAKVLTPPLLHDVGIIHDKGIRESWYNEMAKSSNAYYQVEFNKFYRRQIVAAQKRRMRFRKAGGLSGKY